MLEFEPKKPKPKGSDAPTDQPAFRVPVPLGPPPPARPPLQAVVRPATQAQAQTTRPTTTKAYEYSHQVTDTPYGWTAAYAVQNTPSAYRVTIRVQVSAAKGVKPAEVERVKKQTSLEFARYWDARFVLKDAKGKTKPLRVALQFVTEKAHLKINLSPGDGRDNLTRWYVQSSALDRAHELGHQLGMKDEYLDSTATSRDDPKDSGVKTDHSLMGNYYDEGKERADVKLRHGQVLAAAISSVTGQKLTAQRSGTYIVRAGDTLNSLALRLLGDAKKADALYETNKNIIPATKKLKAGMTLRLP